MLSSRGMAKPFFRSRAINAAHSNADSGPHGRQTNRSIRRSNHASKEDRLLPAGRSRIPSLISPKINESIATSASCRLNHAITFGDGSGFVASERTFTSTRNFIRIQGQLRQSIRNQEANRGIPGPGNRAANPPSLHWVPPRYAAGGNPLHRAAPLRRPAPEGHHRVHETRLATPTGLSMKEWSSFTSKMPSYVRESRTVFRVK
jgi:hypothetical protein